MTSVAVLVFALAQSPLLGAPEAEVLLKRATPTPARLDRILLSTGDVMEGRVLGMDGGMLSIRMESPAGSFERRVPISRVESFVIDSVAESPVDAELDPRGMGWSGDTATSDVRQPPPEPTLPPAPTALPQSLPVSGWVALDGSQQPTPEPETPEAFADRLNNSEKPLTRREERLVELYNDHVHAEREALKRLAEAYHLRTKAAEFGSEPDERRDMLRRADRLQEESLELQEESQERYAEYLKAYESRR